MKKFLIEQDEKFMKWFRLYESYFFVAIVAFLASQYLFPSPAITVTMKSVISVGLSIYFLLYSRLMAEDAFDSNQKEDKFKGLLAYFIACVSSFNLFYEIYLWVM